MPTLNIICFVNFFKKKIRGSVCIFESDTVNSDCPVQIFLESDEIFEDLSLPY